MTSITALLQYLYAWYNWLFPSPAPAATKCPILELPDELVLCITDHLAAHDQFLLSQTCRTMQRLASRDWNEYVRSRSPPERNEFLIGVAFGAPYHWACETCGRLHVVDPHDLPSERRLRPCVRPTDYGARTWARYYLEHHHIQLALKLSGRESNRDHLERLLTTHHYATSSRMPMTYSASPRIVEGHFLLYEKIVVGDCDRRATYSSMQQSLVTICPHLAMVDSPLDYRRMMAWLHQTAEFHQAVAHAVINPGQEVHRHCRWCPTDYTAVYYQLSGQLVFSAWHDFGAYGSVSNRHWSSQARRQSGLGPQLPPRFNRMPGACRAAYTNKRLWRL
ncbi:hypothetical protein TRIATDRAFT_274861 [Trichoderma atroviride IMI 206040]|uniref:F-box domain-containing protein n=1 Tax=Hypocrea atroviridis (strain ATCC 20476 / IMI 206040) TaxID=452589 RepID=G9NWL6_HYPAI|nr:uncharacterized protein TRIATDRAFT_274861 [Trichoderma atroviride IMI 206040]EHK45370.1 hypothetical protein TRIATDRAFT_274861 [Trichoderma atroviride IMI 206040]